MAKPRRWTQAELSLMEDFDQTWLKKARAETERMSEEQIKKEVNEFRYGYLSQKEFPEIGDLKK